MPSGPFSSPFGANANPFGGSTDAPQGGISGMHPVVEEEETDTVASPTSSGFGFSASFRSQFTGDGTADGSAAGIRSPPNPESYPAQYNFGRRTSVSAESLKPSADTYDNWTPPYHEKTADQLGRLKTSIQDNFLFSHLDDEQSAQILGALVEKPIPAKGIKVRPATFSLCTCRIG
jgi:cAMP-dependent protein kinase regulator